MSSRFNTLAYATPIVHEIAVPKAPLEHDPFIDGLIAPYVQLSLLIHNPNIFETTYE